MRCSVSLAAISLGFFVSLQAHAFTSTVNQRSLSRRHVSAFESRIESASVMEQIGLDEGRLAIGVDSQEVLTFIGTREDLIEKTLADIKSFDRAKAEAEVDKFFLDSEAINMYIQFQKMKADDPNFSVPEERDEEGFFSFRTLVFAYLSYVFLNIGSTFLRRWIGEQELAGTWSPTGVGFFDDWVANTVPSAISMMEKGSELIQ